MLALLLHLTAATTTSSSVRAREPLYRHDHGNPARPHGWRHIDPTRRTLGSLPRTLRDDFILRLVIVAIASLEPILCLQRFAMVKQ